jgi:hypothetical protein
MVVLVPEVHDTENLGGFGVLYHDHAALGVVDLYGHAQVGARLVFVLHLQRGLHRGLLLPSPVAPKLQGIVGVEAPGSQVSRLAHAPEDGPDMGHPIVVPQLQGHPYRVVSSVRLRLRSVGWQAVYLLHRYSERPKELPKSLILRGPRSTQDKQGLCEGSDKGTVWVAEPVPVSGEKWGKGKEDMGTGNISINTAYIRASEAFRAFSGQ